MKTCTLFTTSLNVANVSILQFGICNAFMFAAMRLYMQQMDMNKIRFLKHQKKGISVAMSTYSTGLPPLSLVKNLEI